MIAVVIQQMMEEIQRSLIRIQQRRIIQRKEIRIILIAQMVQKV